MVVSVAMSVRREVSFLVSRFPFHGEASAHVAQSVEHVLGKDEVTSSILVVGSIGTGNGKR